MSTSYYGSHLDRYIEHNDQSTLHKMKETYWTTKQAVIKKLGKKEDEHVVASDHELDAKLEVFRAIQKSSMELLRVIEKYQDRICALSQEENATGRFLKSQSSIDKTRAGKMMAAVGKSQSFAAQQRLALRVPLVRLYQEVETFRYRAISDTLMTINRMEGARTEYRGALLWMKAVSEELDPDTYKQLEKFRKVQAQVRKTKARFDKLKLDVMQKIDLLAASRCNMFSHVLANYQSTLLHFWEKTSRTMTAVSESFKGYQYYEFSMLKELTEPSKKLCETTQKREQAERDTDGGEEPQKLLTLEEENESKEKKGAENNGSLHNLYEPDKSDTENDKNRIENPFIDFGEDDDVKNLEDFTSQELAKIKAQKMKKASENPDLLCDNIEADDSEKDDMALLNEILNAPSTGEDEFTREWQAVFGPASHSTTTNFTPVESDQSQAPAGFMPSSLLEMSSQMGRLDLSQAANSTLFNARGTPSGTGENDSFFPSGQLATSSSTLPAASSSFCQSAAQPSEDAVANKQTKPQAKNAQKTDMSAWFNLFADLDPLANPDAIGKKADEITDA